MGRRRSAVMVLIVGLFVVLALPRLLQTGLTGEASALDLPKAPHVGDCVAVAATTEDVWHELTPVACDQFHDAEVTARWTADYPLRPPDVGAANCAGQARVWADAGPELTPLWLPAFEFDAGFVITSEYGWSACVISPASHQQYTGSARGAATSPQRPAAFGRCLLAASTVSCLSPHTVEYLGLPMVFEAGSPANPAVGDEAVAFLLDGLASNCDQLARRVMATTDPSVGGVLTVATTREDDGGADRGYPAVAVHAGCTVRAADGRLLGGSVFGLGTAPVPFV